MKLRFTLLALVCASGLVAQEAPMFPKPSYFRKMFSNPTGHVELQPPVKLADYAVDGKLELSLRSFLDLVMANNTDISIQKISVETSRDAILNAFGRFDPTLTVGASNTHSVSPSSTQLQGANVVKQTQWPLNFTYNQLLDTGTSFSVGLNGSKTANNNSFATFNPSYSSNYQMSFVQPLLRGRSPYITRLPITIARANLRSTELNIRNQIISLIQTAENAYWDVVGARETLRVNQEALKLKDEALKRSQRELELGAIPQLDIYQPQADYASAQIQVSQSSFTLAQREDALRRQIGADLDPKFRNTPIVLTETLAPPNDTAALDREALVQKAISTRPDLQSARIGMDIDDMNIRQNADLLRPNLSFTGSYSSTGRGGPQLIKNTLGDTTVSEVIPGGLSDAVSQVFGFGYTTYQMGLSLTLPLRNRSGAANLADALVRKKSDALTIRRSEQQVRLDVLNAVSQVESSREAVKLAAIARDLAQKQLDAQWQEYNLGTTTMYYVLDAQTRLTNAESNVVSQEISYRRNELNLLRVVGTLLEERGVTVQ